MYIRNMVFLHPEAVSRCLSRCRFCLLYIVYFYNIPAYIGSVRDSFYTISGNETFHGLVGGIMNTDGFVKKSFGFNDKI